MIDLHSHLLPGVDDGSPSVEVSVPVLEKFGRDGVTIVVCTPHLNASQAASAPIERHRAILGGLRAQAPASPELWLGWEIMLDAPGADLSHPDLSLAGSRALLVEFTRGGLPPGSTAELRRIARSGRTPILAHPERYFGCTVEAVRAWRKFGVVIQTDVSVLMGRGAPADLACAMLREGLIDILASDNHGDHRSLGAARGWLLEHGAGEEHVELLTHRNAELVLSDEDTIQVPPVRSGLIDRVKHIFRR